MASQQPFEQSVRVRASASEDERGRVIRFPRHAHPNARFPRFAAIRTGADLAESPRIAAGGAWGAIGYAEDGDGVLLSPDLFRELSEAGAARDRDARWVYVRRARPREVLLHARHLRGPALAAGIVAAAATATVVDQALSSTAPLVIALAALVLGVLAAIVTGVATMALAARS